MAGNPLSCTCELLWLARWVQRGGHHQHHEARCASPTHLSNQRLSQLQLDKLTCDTAPIRCPGDKCSFQQEQCGIPDQQPCLCSMDQPCSVCPRGTYAVPSSVKGSVRCTSCPPYHTSPIASKSAHQCVCREGYEVSQDGGCAACPGNTSKATVGPGRCSPCPPGGVTYTEASSYCVCAPGFTLLHNGLCTKCLLDTYKEGVGPGGCERCPRHSSSPPGSTGPEQCVCIHGTFSAIPGAKYGMCQEYPQQEQIELGLLPAPVGSNRASPNNVVTRLSEAKDLGPLLGVIGTLLSLALAAFLSIWCRHRQRCKQSGSYKSSRTRFPSDLIPVRSMRGMYVSNELYARFETPASTLHVRQLVGQGAFGQVHEAIAHHLAGADSKEPIKVAVKSLRENATQEEEDALRSELDQMIFVGKHPHIISLLGACTQNDQLMIIMEFACHGNLQNYLKERCPGDEYFYLRGKPCPRRGSGAVVQNIMEDVTLMSIAWQIAKGMQHLSNMKMIHRDLAARNVLLADNMVAKVSDFGLAREVYENGYYFKNSNGRLPYKWMSPEALLCGQYTTKSDVWSYGIVLWEIATFGGTPYPGVPVDQMYDMLKAGYRMRQPTSCPVKLYEVMLHCWHESSSDRPLFSELVEKFDKIVQAAAQKEYLDLQDEPTRIPEVDACKVHLSPPLSDRSPIKENQIFVSLANYPKFCSVMKNNSTCSSEDESRPEQKKEIIRDNRKHATDDTSSQRNFEKRIKSSTCLPALRTVKTLNGAPTCHETNPYQTKTRDMSKQNSPEKIPNVQEVEKVPESKTTSEADQHLDVTYDHCEELVPLIPQHEEQNFNGSQSTTSTRRRESLSTSSQ